MKVEHQPAYVLHHRPYRDTSALVDFITPDHGRLSGLVRGVYRKHKDAAVQRALLQPNTPLLLSWFGKTSLKTITSIESVAPPFTCSGERLYCAFYINEVLTRLLPPNEANVILFERYSTVLKSLSETEPVEPILRSFEYHLLATIGYALDLGRDCMTGDPVHPHHYYQFRVDRGVQFYSAQPPQNSKLAIYSGAILLSVAQQDWESEHTRLGAKHLMRCWLGHYLGKKPLKSRSFFKTVKSTS